MLVYPAASELNTQPVHKIPFINALFSLPETRSILSSSLSLVRSPTAEVVALSFFIYIFVSNLFRSLHVVGRPASRLARCYYFLFFFSFFFFVFIATLAERHSVLAVLACNNFASAQTHRNSRLAIAVLVSFCITIALHTYSFVIFILTLRYLFSFLSLYLCWHVYVLFVLYVSSAECVALFLCIVK